MKKLFKFDFTVFSAPVIAIYLALSFVFSDFGISAVIGAFLLCAWTGLCFLHFLFVKKGKLELKAPHLLVLALNLFVFVNILRNFSLDRTLIYYVIILVSGSVLFWISSPPTDRILSVTRYSVVGIALLFSVVNIIYTYFPKQVSKVAFSIITKTSISYNNRLAAEGYGFAFGEDVGYTAFIIAFGLAIVWFSIKDKNLKTHLPMIFILAFGLFAVQRRGELIVCLVAITVVTFIKWLKSRKWKVSPISNLKTIVAPILCVVLTLIVFNTVTIDSRYDYHQYLSSDLSQTEEVEGNVENIDIDKFGNGRMALWKIAIEGFSDKPILGNGWRSFKDMAPESGNIHAINAHNVYLQLLCETGVVGFCIAGTVFVWMLVLVLKKTSKTTDQKNCKYYLLGIYIILAMLGQGVIDNSLYYPYWIQAFQLMLFFVFLRKETQQSQITD
ncbi:MAG: O-antigen ligase family protein [Clostridia bacterium]|nr:O-antigen ligase family protein [Clostridia bacterium]